jgi:MinD-like ATPase involved in chromosome partitioning or flagellar assembly
VNLAASLARDPERRRVCVVDADPLNLDVTTRLTVRGPVLEDFAEDDVPVTSALGSVHEPPLWVLPSTGAGVGLTRRATPRALHRLRGDFDVVICDLLGGASGPAGVIGRRLDPLDWLLVAVTPRADAVADAAELLAQLRADAEPGGTAEAVRIGVVTTGDEGTAELTPDVVAGQLGERVVGSVRQLWGRAAPNLGFGAALGIEDLDDAVAALFDRLGRSSAGLGASSPEFARSS